jgi:Rod binding domain-containing protein
MEGYFVGSMLKKMHESASKSGLADESSESATFREMFDEAVGQEIGKRGSFGLADALYKELAGRQPVASVPQPGVTAAAAEAVQPPSKIGPGAPK